MIYGWDAIGMIRLEVMKRCLALCIGRLAFDMCCSTLCNASSAFPASVPLSAYVV